MDLYEKPPRKGKGGKWSGKNTGPFATTTMFVTMWNGEHAKMVINALHGQHITGLGPALLAVIIVRF